MSVNDMLLISEVQKYPYLYDRRDKHFTNMTVKESTWSKIGEYLYVDADAAKNRWENLRDRFVRAHREFTAKTGSPKFTKHTSFQYYQNMLWLTPHLRKRKLVSLGDRKSKLSNTPETNAVVKTEGTQPQPKPEIVLISETTEREYIEENSNASMFAERNLGHENSTNSNNESDLLFMKSIVADMQGITPKNKIRFKKEVLDLLIKYIE